MTRARCLTPMLDAGWAFGSALPLASQAGADLAAGGALPASLAPAIAASAQAAPSFEQRFEQVRTSVVSAPRDAALLRREIVAMRDKVRAAHPIKGDNFDVKHSPGGMVDAEFAVQFLVLAQSTRHPALVPNIGNIALLQRAESADLLPPGVGRQAASAYRELRRVQHRARLNEEPTQLSPPALAAERAAIERLWAAVFEGKQAI